MAFDWREFLIIAHALRNEPGEGAQRTSLGRAYYYVFNLGLANARALRFTGQLPGLHGKLWYWCQQHSDPTIRQIGLNGRRMHSLRIEADYGDRVTNLASEVRKQLSRAQNFEVLVAQRNGTTPPPPLSR
jgi:hypothetical protein